MLVRSLCCVFIILLAGADSVEPAHLRDARSLIAEIQPADNKYVYKSPYLHWKGDAGFDHYENHSDCSAFLNLLLAHSYGTTETQLKEWTGHLKPTATHWHDAIVDGKLTAIEHLADARPGDVLAVKFPAGLPDTGHVMMVAELPVAITATAPIVPDTHQWKVTIIDSTKFPHGSTDTRYQNKSTGVGQGDIRIYTNSRGEVAGYCWSDAQDTKFRAQSDRNMAIGRLVIGKRPG